MKKIDKGVFFIKDDKILLELYDLQGKFIYFIYDGKNTIVLNDEKKEEYILENIVPEVRSELKNKEKIMILHNENGEIKEMYVLNIKIDETLSFKDNFKEKSIEMYNEMNEFVNM